LCLLNLFLERQKELQTIVSVTNKTLVQEALTGNLANLVQMETLENLDILETQVLQETIHQCRYLQTEVAFSVLGVLLVHGVAQANLEQWDHLVMSVHTDNVDLQVTQDLLDLMATMEQLDPRVTEARTELKVARDIRVKKDLTEPLVQLEVQVDQALLVKMANLVLLDLLV